MQIEGVKFNANDQPEFFKELRRRVNQYFLDNNLSKHANLNMKFKTAFMLSLYFIPLILMLTWGFTTIWAVTLMWVLMGFGMSGIGLSIMHDANHGSYSSDQNVNNMLGYVINFVGGYHVNWKIQHNVLHHSFTNIDGFDEDIDKGVMRFSPNQKRKWIFKYQLFYTPLFYSILSLYWITVKDFQQLFRYSKRDLLVGQGLTFNKALVQIVFNKAAYWLVTFVLPMVVLDFPWWQILLGFVLMHVICGLTLACIFQSAHVIEDTDFYTADEEGCVENNWAIHQMRTTANFAKRSFFFSWFIGGLNYQIEHHLFPNICHVHYQHISGIVEKTAKEFNVPYYQHRTFWGALKSHFTLLNQLGTGEYDRKLIADY